MLIVTMMLQADQPLPARKSVREQEMNHKSYACHVVARGWCHSINRIYQGCPNFFSGRAENDYQKAETAKFLALIPNRIMHSVQWCCEAQTVPNGVRVWPDTHPEA